MEQYKALQIKLIIIENGTYYVIVTENNCQSLPSDVITINNVSIEFMIIMM